MQKRDAKERGKRISHHQYKYKKENFQSLQESSTSK